MGWIRACGLQQIGDNEMVGLDIANKKVLLVKKDSKVFALDAVCTHQYADLSTGFLGESAVTCPLHLSQFDLETGRALNPPAEKPLRSYKVKIEDNAVYVLLD